MRAGAESFKCVGSWPVRPYAKVRFRQERDVIASVYRIVASQQFNLGRPMGGCATFSKRNGSADGKEG